MNDDQVILATGNQSKIVKIVGCVSVREAFPKGSVTHQI
jgi:hypothetical protein